MVGLALSQLRVRLVQGLRDATRVCHESGVWLTERQAPGWGREACMGDRVLLGSNVLTEGLFEGVHRRRNSLHWASKKNALHLCGRIAPQTTQFTFRLLFPHRGQLVPILMTWPAVLHELNAHLDRQHRGGSRRVAVWACRQGAPPVAQMSQTQDKALIVHRGEARGRSGLSTSWTSVTKRVRHRDALGSCPARFSRAARPPVGVPYLTCNLTLCQRGGGSLHGEGESESTCLQHAVWIIRREPLSWISHERSPVFVDAEGEVANNGESLRS